MIDAGVGTIPRNRTYKAVYLPYEIRIPRFSWANRSLRDWPIFFEEGLIIISAIGVAFYL